MEKAGVTNYDKLTKAQKNEVKSIATEAAKIVDLKLVFNKKSVAIYNNDGKLVETVSNTNGKLAYTGNVVNVVVLATNSSGISCCISSSCKKKNCKCLVK